MTVNIPLSFDRWRRQEGISEDEMRFYYTVAVWRASPDFRERPTDQTIIANLQEEGITRSEEDLRRIFGVVRFRYAMLPDEQQLSLRKFAFGARAWQEKQRQSYYASVTRFRRLYEEVRSWDVSARSAKAWEAIYQIRDSKYGSYI